MTLTHKLLRFDGRIRRRDWWLFSIGLLLAENASVRLMMLAIDGSSSALQQGNVFTWLMSDDYSSQYHLISSVFLLTFTWPQLALTTKRAKDRDRSIRFAQLVLLASVTLSLFPQGTAERWGNALDAGDLFGGIGLLISLTVGILSIASIVMLGFLDGTPGYNRHGTSPKALGGDHSDSLAEVFD